MEAGGASGSKMFIREAADGLRSNRLIRLRVLVLARTLGQQMSTVQDALAFTALGFVACIMLLSAWSKIWSIRPSEAYALGALLSVPIAFAAVRNLRRQRSWMRQHGILSRDALRRDTWLVYEFTCQIGIALCVWLPVVAMTGHLSGQWILSTLASAALFVVACFATLRRMGRPASGSSATSATMRTLSGHSHRRRDIALRRRLGGAVGERWGWMFLLLSGLLAGMFPSAIAYAGGSLNWTSAAGLASVVLPLLWLTRQDADLVVGMSLAGVSPLRSAQEALAPAAAFAAAATGGLLGVPLVSSNPPVLVLLPGASLVVLAIIYLFRAWRAPRMTRRSADMLACCDLAIMTLAGILAPWLAGVVCLLLLWRLHRRATAELLML